jgi:hypothetical protein
MREAFGFHGLAQLRGGALGSAVDQSPQGPIEGVWPRHVYREDAPSGGQDLDEREARIPLGRDPFRLEPYITAVAGKRVLRGRTGREPQHEPIEGPQVVGGGLGGALGTAIGYCLTERFHDQALWRGFFRAKAVWQGAEVAET